MVVDRMSHDAMVVRLMIGRRIPWFSKGTRMAVHSGWSFMMGRRIQRLLMRIWIQRLGDERTDAMAVDRKTGTTVVDSKLHDATVIFGTTDTRVVYANTTTGVLLTCEDGHNGCLWATRIQWLLMAVAMVHT